MEISSRPRVRPWALALGLAFAAAVLLLDSPLNDPAVQGELGSRPARAAAVALLMATWWLTEALPIYWTACVPLVAFPLLGLFGRGLLGDLGSSIRPFVDPYIFLFAGGMAIAAAMQQWNLHRRLALGIMNAIGTKIGTAPNAQFAGFLERRGVGVSFLQFALVGLPFVFVMLPIAWLLLCRLAAPDRLHADAREVVRAQLAELGPIGRGEQVVLAVFAVTAALWALEPRSLVGVPWETLLLLGGGFAMAAGIQDSGLSRWLAGELAVIAQMPPLGQIVLASLATVAISAVASNTATVAVMLVVLADAASAEARNAVLFAATIAASCDFALPVGTPPNAIVFGSGYVRIPTMARYGAPLDLIGALVAALWCALVVPFVLS